MPNILTHQKQYKTKCKKFVSFREIFNDPNEPVTRGICLENPVFDNNEIRFLVVDESTCEKCKMRSR